MKFLPYFIFIFLFFYFLISLLIYPYISLFSFPIASASSQTVTISAYVDENLSFYKAADKITIATNCPYSLTVIGQQNFTNNQSFVLENYSPNNPLIITAGF